MKKEIPNIITLCNLMCGCLSIGCTFTDRLAPAGWMLAAAAVFDLLDGAVARLLRVSSPVGKELDSLADVVSFGVAPSCMAYFMMLSQAVNPFLKFPLWLCGCGFIMAVFSAYRLAKFNLDESGEAAFKGMPTPANGLFWAALTLYWTTKGVVIYVWALPAVCALMCWLMVCPWKMFSFKGKDWGLKARAFIYGYVAVAAVLPMVWGYLGFAIDVLLYPCFSILHYKFDKTENL